MFSQTAEYAIRAIVWLAENNDGGPVGNQKIAEGTQVPVTYLAKILQQLTKSGLVTSKRGVGGGFVLSFSADEITVLDIVNAVDPIGRITSCPLNLKSHAHKRCGMHARMDKAMEMVETVLSQSTVAEIINDKTRPTPLRNSKKR